MTTLASVGVRAVPFDLAALDATPDWRRGLAWPMAVPNLAAPMRAGTAALLRAALALDDPRARDAALLILPAFANRARAVVMAALALDAARDVDLVGGPPELDALRGGALALGAGDELALPADRGMPPRWRAVARAASWTPLQRLPRLILRPDAIAVTHNPLLAAAARRGPAAIGFVHAARLMARASAAGSDAGDMTAVARALADTLIGPFAFTPAMATRVHGVLRALAERALGSAWRDLDGLARLDLPAELWSGTGGNHAARAIGLAVMARGGRVSRFAHGGSLGPVAMAEQAVITELAVSDRFVVGSEPVRRLLTRGAAPALVAPRRVDLDVVADTVPPPALPARARPARPKVLYVATASLGFTVHAPPFLPDVLYLDWQLRLAASLARLRVDVLAKPHPEGLWRGRRHPLTDVVAATSAPFERVMGDADVYVFDYPCSTTFWTALATERPVVFLDLGLVPFAPDVVPEVERRCAVLRVAYGPDNRPVVPAEALADAIAGAQPGDPTYWRALQGFASS
jgi:hypothetical protein